MSNRWLASLFALVTGACSYTVHPSTDGGSTSPVIPPVGTHLTGDAGTVACSGSNESCYCYAYSTPNSTSCSESTVTNGTCCASASWPSSGTCTCQRFSCNESADYCSCSASGSSFGAASCSPTGGGVCCKNSSSCTCDGTATSCSVGTQVASCTIAESTCFSGQVAVTSCSVTP